MRGGERDDGAGVSVDDQTGGGLHPGERGGLEAVQGLGDLLAARAAAGISLQPVRSRGEDVVRRAHDQGLVRSDALFDQALLFLRTGRVGTDGIVTNMVPLEGFADALAAVASSRSIKAVMTP